MHRAIVKLDDGAAEEVAVKKLNLENREVFELVRPFFVLLAVAEVGASAAAQGGLQRRAVVGSATGGGGGFRAHS